MAEATAAASSVILCVFETQHFGLNGVQHLLQSNAYLHLMILCQFPFPVFICSGMEHNMNDNCAILDYVYKLNIQNLYVLAFRKRVLCV